MNYESLNISMKNLSFLTIIAALLILVIWDYHPVAAQGHDGNGPQVGVRGFIDEDGDGFNDLLPDSDGDGVPDALDPDSRGQHRDSVFSGNHMQVRGDSTRQERHMGDDSLHIRMHGDPGMLGPGGYGMGDPGQFHGEPGQYGPGDSSMHGGMCPDDSMGGHHHGGMGPDGGGMGPGPEKIGNGDNSSDGSRIIGQEINIERPAPIRDAESPRQEIKNEERGH